MLAYWPDHYSYHMGPCWDKQDHSRQSGWSGFGRTTIFQDNNKIPFHRKQVINKSTRVILDLYIYGLLYYDTVDRDDEVENN